MKQSGNGIFASPVIIGGRIAGVWKRSFTKDGVSVEISSFGSLNKIARLAIDAAVSEFATFLNMPVLISIR
ncbi:MAG: hypothetical protein H7122_05640 [Chitinophagaceae bacterium]|nr:hypothetical protein [Chitinophagaceae bacterium]